MASQSSLPDAPAGNWVDRLAPPGLRPYLRLMRLDRPIGWWLLLFPAWWSLALAGDVLDLPYPPPRLLLLFLVGAIVMRGAGCVYNDILDRDIDARVERTKSRPLPAGEIGVGEAIGFLAVLLFVGLMVLIQFNWTTVVLSLSSLAIVAAYPLMKRVTSVPQLVLGLAFGWGGLLGWSSLVGRLHAPALYLYAGAVLWTIGYDTIYALQDREDDALIGIGSTARLFAGREKAALAILYAGAVALIATAFYLALGANPARWPAYAGLATAAALLAMQVVRLEAGQALQLFRSNQWVGWAIFLGLLADAYLSSQAPQSGGHGFAMLP